MQLNIIFSNNCLYKDVHKSKLLKTKLTYGSSKCLIPFLCFCQKHSSKLVLIPGTLSDFGSIGFFFLEYF